MQEILTQAGTSSPDIPRSRSRVDLHTHTWEGSADGLSTIKDVIYQAARLKQEGLVTAIAITDHDNLEALSKIQPVLDSIEPESRPLVIRGVEISLKLRIKPSKHTFIDFAKGYASNIGRHPHVLVVGLQEDAIIPAKKDLKTIAEWAHKQGAVVVAAHVKRKKGITSFSVKEVVKNTHRGYLDGAEVANRHGIKTKVMEKLQQKLEQSGLQLAFTGGSDAHRAEDIGCALTEIDGQIVCAGDVIDAIRQRRTNPYILREVINHSPETPAILSAVWEFLT